MSHGYHAFAPLDLPDEIASIEAVTSHFFSLPQVACFDITARCRKRRTRSALPRALSDEDIRRHAHELIFP